MLESLKAFKACKEGIEWVKGHSSLEEAWIKCEKLDWLVWYVGKVFNAYTFDMRLAISEILSTVVNQSKNNLLLLDAISSIEDNLVEMSEKIWKLTGRDPLYKDHDFKKLMKIWSGELDGAEILYDSLDENEFLLCSSVFYLLGKTPAEACTAVCLICERNPELEPNFVSIFKKHFPELPKNKG